MTLVTLLSSSVQSSVCDGRVTAVAQESEKLAKQRELAKQTELAEMTELADMPELAE